MAEVDSSSLLEEESEELSLTAFGCFASGTFESLDPRAAILDLVSGTVSSSDDSSELSELDELVLCLDF